MRIIEITAYKFDELSDSAKEKAREWYRDGGIYPKWWEYTYEDAENIGLKITGFDLDRNRHATGEFTLSAAEVAQNISTNHGETCGTYKTAEAFIEDWQPIFSEYMDESSEHYESYEHEERMQDLEDDFLKSLLEDYSIMLQNEYEYLMGDECVDESIIANDYEFNKNGEMI